MVRSTQDQYKSTEDSYKMKENRGGEQVFIS